MSRNEYGGRLSFRVLPLSGVDEDLIEKWKRLADAAVEPNPYHDPRFLVTSARQRADAGGLQLALVEGESDLLAVLAFSVTNAFSATTVRALSTRGPFMDQIGDIRHPLVSPSAPVETWMCLLGGLRSSNLPGLLLLENFPGDGPLAASLNEAVTRLGIPVLERARDERAVAIRADLDDDSQSLFDLAHSRASSRKQRARAFASLERAVGGGVRMEDRSSDPAAIDEFLDLEASGWKGDPNRGGRALRLVGHDRWFSAVASAFREDGKLVVLALTDDRRDTIYLTVSFRAGAGVVGCLDTFDERFSEFSAGTLGRTAEWKYALSELGAEFFDPNLSSFYADSTRLYPQRRPHVTLLLGHGDMAARAIVRAIPRLARARATLSVTTRRLRS
jgi:hypothetical protein